MRKIDFESGGVPHFTQRDEVTDNAVLDDARQHDVDPNKLKGEKQHTGVIGGCFSMSVSEHALGVMLRHRHRGSVFSFCDTLSHGFI